MLQICVSFGGFPAIHKHSADKTHRVSKMQKKHQTISFRGELIFSAYHSCFVFVVFPFVFFNCHDFDDIKEHNRNPPKKKTEDSPTGSPSIHAAIKVFQSVVASIFHWKQLIWISVNPLSKSLQ